MAFSGLGGSFRSEPPDERETNPFSTESETARQRSKKYCAGAVGRLRADEPQGKPWDSAKRRSSAGPGRTDADGNTKEGK